MTAFTTSAENANFLRLILSVNILGHETLSGLLKAKIPTKKITSFLYGNKRHFKGMLKNKKLNNAQYETLFPTPIIKDWDLALYTKVFQVYLLKSKHSTDHEFFRDVLALTAIRNCLCHNPSVSVSNNETERMRHQIRDTCKRLTESTNTRMIKTIEDLDRDIFQTPLDPVDEKQANILLRSWKDANEDESDTNESGIHNRHVEMPQLYPVKGNTSDINRKKDQYVQCFSSKEEGNVSLSMLLIAGLGGFLIGGIAVGGLVAFAAIGSVLEFSKSRNDGK